jgi:hypothetical protein
VRNTFDRVALCFLCVLAASHCGDDDDPGDADAAGRGGGAGRPGSAGNVSAGGRPSAGAGEGGSAAGRGTAGTAGAGRGAAGGGTAGDRGGAGAAGVDSSDLDSGVEDDAGPSAGAAASGSGGAGGAEEGGSGGSSGNGGAGGNGGEGGSGGEVDQAAEQCVNDSMAAGQTITDCERCLCQTGVCQTQMNAIKDDVNANALVKCSQENMCSGQCCLCGDTCSLTNYGDGMCAAEAKVAAGVAPDSGLEAILTVMERCAEAGPEDSACARAARLSACALSNCAAMCPNLPACE